MQFTIARFHRFPQTPSAEISFCPSTRFGWPFCCSPATKPSAAVKKPKGGDHAGLAWPRASQCLSVWTPDLRDFFSRSARNLGFFRKEVESVDQRLLLGWQRVFSVFLKSSATLGRPSPTLQDPKCAAPWSMVRATALVRRTLEGEISAVDFGDTKRRRKPGHLSIGHDPSNKHRGNTQDMVHWGAMCSS